MLKRYLVIISIFIIFQCVISEELIDELDERDLDVNTYLSTSEAESESQTWDDSSTIPTQLDDTNESKPKRFEADEDDQNNESCCGEHSTDCYYEDLEKVCTCESGYAQTNTSESGECKKCDCGHNAISCEFVSNEKKCTCAEKFIEVSGICLECDCGLDSEACSFNSDLERKCICKEGTFLLPDGNSTHETCKKCDCGSYSTSCTLDVHGIRKCTCVEGYFSYRRYSDGEDCFECDCGPHASSCEIDYLGYRRCFCEDGYTRKLTASFYENEDCIKNESESSSRLSGGTYLLIIAIAMVCVGLSIAVISRWQKSRRIRELRRLGEL